MSAVQDDAHGTDDLVYRPKARLLRILGEELISDEIIAVIELVKNAYDADASLVKVRLYLDEPTEAAIEIIDDGLGMTREQLTGPWMQPGDSWKAERKNSASGRALLGRKGVGRFAADKLAAKLEIRTKQAGSKVEYRAEFDWDQFEDSHKFLDEIRFKLQENEAEDESAHGTSLLLKPLRRSSWDEEMVMKLRMELLKLQLPTSRATLDSFQIEFVVGHEVIDVAAQLGELLRNAPLIVYAGIRKTKTGAQIVTKINGESRTPVPVDPEAAALQCGDFETTLHVWNRDMEGMQSIREMMGGNLTDARKLLDDWAGISIYRDGFRVYPYGQAGNDWLQLDKSRINRPGERISNNQIIGLVSISQSRNPGLRDQTNRQGLIDGPAYQDFCTVMRQVVTLASNELRGRKSNPKQKPRPKRPLFPRQAIEELERRVSDTDSPPEPKELRALTKKVAEESAEAEKAVYTQIARYNRLLSLGVVAARMAHETRQHIDVIRREADAGRRLLERDAAPRMVSDRFETIDNAAGVISKEVKNISPFIRARRKLEVLDLIVVAEDVIDGQKIALERLQIEVKVSGPRGRLLVRADFTELFQVLHNLVENAIVWLKGVASPRLSLTGTVKSRTALMVVDDNGPGIAPESEDDIFEPFWTTRSEGSGLGLPIAGEILSDLGGEIHLVRNQPGRGCAFQISVPLAKD